MYLSKYKISFRICLTLMLGILTKTLLAQNLPVDIIQVVKDFDARLDEAEKIKVTPEIPVADTGRSKYSYEVNPGILELKYSAPQIRPIAMKPAEPIPSYPFYLKAGYGIPNQALGRLSYYFKNDDRTKIGFDLTHLSSNNKKNKDQRFYDNDLKAHIFHLTEDGLAIQGDALISKDRYHHFGHYIQNPGTATPSQVLKHDYDIFELGAKVFNPKISQNGVNYFAGLNLFNLVDNLSSNEKGGKLDLGITKWIKNKHSVGIELGTDITMFDADTIAQDLNNFYLLPSIGIHGKSFAIQAGVKIASDGENITLFPAVNVSGSIAGNQLMIVAGAEGGLNKNTYRTLSDFNPFITSRPILTNNAFTAYYLGLKGSAKTLEYDLRVGYKQNDNLPLFVLNTKNFSRFGVKYADVDFTYGTASLTFRPSTNIIVNAAINKNFYTKKAEPQAWGLPSIEFNGSVQYKTLNKKLLLTAESYVNDGIPYTDDLGNTGKSNLLLDISLGANYAITKNVGIFTQANNLANSVWRRWYQYPTYGLNAVGGITVKF